MKEIKNGTNSIGCIGKKGAGGVDGMYRNGIDLSFIKKIRFDIKNRFLIG